MNDTDTAFFCKDIDTFLSLLFTETLKMVAGANCIMWYNIITGLNSNIYRRNYYDTFK